MLNQYLGTHSSNLRGLKINIPSPLAKVVKHRLQDSGDPEIMIERYRDKSMAMVDGYGPYLCIYADPFQPQSDKYTLPRRAVRAGRGFKVELTREEWAQIKDVGKIVLFGNSDRIEVWSKQELDEWDSIHTIDELAKFLF